MFTNELGDATITNYESTKTFYVNGYNYNTDKSDYTLGINPVDFPEFEWYLDENFQTKATGPIIGKSYETMKLYAHIDETPTGKVKVIIKYPYSSKSISLL